jgi:dolichol-phosphate mannosyltransferase
MLTTLVFFGILFLAIGLIGEYLYRIYAEVTQRPLYFVSDSTYPRGRS